jgi:hypothetical protein
MGSVSADETIREVLDAIADWENRRMLTGCRSPSSSMVALQQGLAD